jgi:predicted MPP superfamily phosphohydrolase
MSFRLLILPFIVALLGFYTHLNINKLLPNYSMQNWGITIVLFTIILGSQILPHFSLFSRNNWFTRLLAWVGAITMSTWATLTLLSIALDICYLAVTLLHLVFSQFTYSDFIQRENFIHGSFVTLFAISLLISFLGLMQAIIGPQIKKVVVPITDLPSALEQLKIVQISDVHIGATINRSYIQKISMRAMKLNPDIIAITGDLADGNPKDLQEQCAPLTHLKAPLGTYYITGNHEYYCGAEQWIDEGKNLGFIPLINENKIVAYNGCKILIGGVTDINAHHFIPLHFSDPLKASITSEECSFKLLLAHQPESCFKAQAAGFDLQLSGHTHAGQFFPFSILVKLTKRYYRGLRKYKNMWIYINAGTGYWGAANRFGVPSEITLIQLRRA